MTNAVEPTIWEMVDLGSTTLTRLLNELRDIRIQPRPNYAKEGVETVFNALLEARAFADRAASIRAEASTLQAEMESLLNLFTLAYQEKYDTIVARKVQSMGGLSWEERASIYRVEVIELTRELRRMERTVSNAKGTVFAIDTLTKNIERARYDLQALTTVMQFAHALGEL